jgi:hypothetical protein
MWKSSLLLLTVAVSAHAAQTITPADTVPPPPRHQAAAMPSYMVVTPAARAADFQQAFDILKREKSAGKVYFELADGTTIGNVIDMSPMSNSTVILFRYNSSQGIQYQVVKIEDIVNLRY